MKKLLLLLSLWALCACGASSQDTSSFPELPKNDLEAESILGNVKSIVSKSRSLDPNYGIIRFLPENDWEYELNPEHNLRQFDQQGNVTKEIGYLSDGNAERTVNHIYDTKSRKVEMSIYPYYSTVDSGKAIYKHDDKGNVIEINGYSSYGDLAQIQKFKYNEHGYKIEGNIYNSEGAIINKINYKYDKNGLLIEKNTNNPDGTLYLKYEYLYDHKANPIEEIERVGKSYRKWIYKYDDKGRVVEDKFFLNGAFTGKYAYEYTDDEKGNWITQTKHFYDTKTSEFFSNRITERVIEYY